MSLWRNSRFAIHFVYRAPAGITILSKPDQIYWAFDFALETGSEMCRAEGSTPVSWQLRNNQWKIQKWLHNAVRHKTDQVSRETSNSHPMYLQIRRHVRSNIHRHKSHSIIVCVYQVKLWGKFVGATTNFWDWKMAGMNWKKKDYQIRLVYSTLHYRVKKYLDVNHSTAVAISLSTDIKSQLYFRVRWTLVAWLSRSLKVAQMWQHGP